MAISHQKSSEPSVTGRLSQKLGGASSSVLLYAGVAAVLTGYAVYPSKSNPLYPAIFLSYSIPANNDSERTQYGKGPKDLIFVAFYTLVLFAARDFVREHVGRALSRSLGIKDEDRQFKFIQQLWQAVYFGWIACFGLYVMRGLPLWFFNMPGLFEGFPHKTLDGPFKVFYLVHSGNWIQQALVTFIPLEEARNDNWVMVTHHIITLSAIPLVYTWHLTHFALALIIPHDISDSILAVSPAIENSLPMPLILNPLIRTMTCSPENASAMPIPILAFKWATSASLLALGFTSATMSGVLPFGPC